MTNVIRFISRQDAQRVLAAKVEAIKAAYPNLSEEEQIDIMAEYLTDCDPQLRRESARHYWETQE